MNLQGEGFYALASVDLGGKRPATIDNTWSVSIGDVVLTPNGIVSAGNLSVEVPAGLAPGSYDVFVSSPSGETDLLEDGLLVVDDVVDDQTLLRFDNAGIDEDLIRFPVLVTLDPTNFNYDSAAAQGADLLFLDDDDITILPHEIEEWNEGGVSQVWVAVPQIDANSIVDYIHLRYGDMSVAPGEDPTNLWTDYHAVWHLGESGTGAASEFVDSSTPTHSGQGGSGSLSQVPQLATGKIGQAQRFDGNDDRITVDPSDSFLFGTSAVTVSYWASVPDTNNTMVAVGKGGNPGGYRSGFEAGGRVGWYVAGTLMDTPTSQIMDTGFHHIVVTWNGTRMSTYVDGTLITGNSKGGGFNSNTDPFYIGRGPSGFHFNGVIDEVRVLNSSLSAAWIAAQHRSMQNDYISFE